MGVDETAYPGDPGDSGDSGDNGIEGPTGGARDGVEHAAGRRSGGSGSAGQQDRMAERRTRDEYAEAIRAEAADHAAQDREKTQLRGWDASGVADHPDRPLTGDIRLTADRRTHLLDGDASGGGHRYGTGRPGKTEFPADWDDARIASAVLSVAQAPGETPLHQVWNHRWLARGSHDGVGIVAIVEPSGLIWTAWPEEGSPGVVRNPREM